MDKKPNILCIITDEQRFDHLGCTNPSVITPNLDALAADGVRFSRAYTSNPSCVPARAAILTGRYPHECGAPTFITYLPDHETTIMTLMQKTGYHTSYIGKLHIGTSNIPRGLDYEDIIDAHIPNPQAHDTNSYQNYLWRQGFRSTDELINRDAGLRLYADWLVDPKYHIDEFVGTRGRDWMERQTNGGNPFFCTISFPGPHMPIDTGNFPEAELYSDADIDLPKTAFSMLDAKPPHNSLAHGEPPAPYAALTEDEVLKLRKAYYANVTLIDRKIGEIVDVLKERGLYDDTMIIFTSDHGDYLGDFGLSGKGQNVAEVLMRIPFIVKPPEGGATGKVETSLISSVDIAATCLSAAGRETPENMSSRDLSHYWETDEIYDDNDLLYFEAGGIRCLRDRRYKFCHYRDRPYGELYDLEDDPWEKVNLWDSGEYRRIKDEFNVKMINKLIEFSGRSDVRWNAGAPEI